jgi:hypothetical protein
MKRISMILVMVLLLVAALVGCKTTENVVKQSAVSGQEYSYIDIDPIVIGQTWEHVVSVSLNRFIAEMYYKNPDKDEPIQYATLLVSPGGVGGYSYLLNSHIHVCQFNVATNAYESVWDTFDEDSKKEWYADYSEYFGIEHHTGC